VQWYLVNKKRLKAEIKLMEDNGVNFDLYTDDRENLFWRGALRVSGHYHGDVRLVYNQNHPYVQMDDYVLDPQLPQTTHHIFSDGRICYIGPAEWSPEWTAFAVYLTTIRFLEDFYAGRMCGHIPILDVPRERSFLEKFLDVTFPW